MAILNSWKNPEFTYEYVRKHIQLGEELDVEENNIYKITLLKNIVETGAHWKSIARKIIKIRWSTH